MLCLFADFNCYFWSNVKNTHKKLKPTLLTFCIFCIGLYSTVTSAEEIPPDVQVILSAIKQGKDLSKIRDEKGNTLLQKSVLAGRLPVVEALLSNGANPRIPNNISGSTALHYAAITGRINHVKKILEYAPEVDARNHKGETPLTYACFKGYVEIASLLLNSGAEIDGFQNKKLTCLHFASVKSDELVALLLKRGAKPDPLSTKGISPLYYAAKNGNTKTVRLLANAGANPNYRFGMEEVTPLIAAIKIGNERMSRVLIEHGADVNLASGKGLYPLCAAVEANSLELVKLLVTSGASKNTSCFGYSTAYNLAKRKKYNALLEILNES